MARLAQTPGLTDIHAHPALNAFLWDRDLRRHYFTGKAFNPLASPPVTVQLAGQRRAKAPMTKATRPES